MVTSPQYTLLEASSLLLNASLADDGPTVLAFLDDLAPSDFQVLAPALLVVATNAMAMLDPELLEVWRSTTRRVLAGLPAEEAP